MKSAWDGIFDRMAAIDAFYARVGRDEDPVVGFGVARDNHRGFASSSDAEKVSQAVVGLLGGVTAAEPYWVSSEMLDLAEHAGKSFPWEKLDATAPPSAFGYIEFARPVIQEVAGGITAQWEQDAPVWGLVWGRYGGRILIVSLVKRDDPVFLAHLQEDFDESAFRFPPLVQYASLLVTGTSEVPADEETGRWGKFLGSLWTLMEQRIAVSRKERATRAESRRWMRMGNPAPSDVRVITLRRVKVSTGDPADGEFVEWQHRWIVNGHWRMQWYPTLNDHMPIWIAPYIKGPEDKPLVLKRDLRVLVR